MFLKKWGRLLKVLGMFEIRRFRYYFLDVITSLGSKIVYLLINVAFWYVVMDAGYTIHGWSYGDIIVFIAFSELFYGLDRAVFSAASRFWRVIYSGTLDNGLTRPIDPRLKLFLLNIDYMEVAITMLEFIFLLFLSGNSLSVGKVCIGILMVILANLILALIRLGMSYFAFWHGKMDAITELADSMTSFNKYPLVIMPKVVRCVFQFVLPFYFFSTFSAEIVNFTLGYRTFLIAFAGVGCNIALWGTINHVLWKKGLARYEGIHG